MKSKKCKKCANCKHFNGNECTHRSNLGLKVKYSQEYTYYIKTPEILNADGKCLNYEQI